MPVKEQFKAYLEHKYLDFDERQAQGITLLEGHIRSGFLDQSPETRMLQRGSVNVDDMHVEEGMENVLSRVLARSSELEISVDLEQTPPTVMVYRPSVRESIFQSREEADEYDENEIAELAAEQVEAADGIQEWLGTLVSRYENRRQAVDKAHNQLDDARSALEAEFLIGK